jgi:hypothetical protein
MAETKREVLVWERDDGTPYKVELSGGRDPERFQVKPARYVPSDQALSSGVERADPWEALAGWSAAAPGRMFEADKGGAGRLLYATDQVTGGEDSGVCWSYTEAARSLCAKLGIPVAPVASPAAEAGKGESER